MKKYAWIIVVIIALILFNRNCKDDNTTTSTFSNFSSKTKVENVKINKDNEFAWGLTGMIRNESSSKIKGYAKIKFLNGKGDIVHTASCFVNDRDYLKPGQAGVFEYYTIPKNFDGVVDFDIEFIEK